MVMLMEKENVETSDETTIGAACEIQLRKQGKYQYKFAKIEDEKFDGYDNNDIVYVLTPSEYSQIMEDIDSTKRIDELEKTIAVKNEKINSLNKRIDELEQSLEKKNQENNTIDEYKETLQYNNKKINDLTTSNNNDNSISESEYGSLKEQLKNAKQESEYWQNKYETKQELISYIEKQEKELKETKEKQQTDISELTQKYESLIPNKDYIPQTTHYKALQELKDEIHASKLEHEQKIGELQLDYTNKISNLETTFANEKSDLKIEHTNEKAQMMVAYNKELNNLKHEKNDIASKYNELLEDVGTITRMNAVFSNKHKHILENKAPMELEDITSEQLPSANETIEYVPKD